MRVFIIIVAIAASIGLVIVSSSLSAGIRESSRRSIESVGADFYVVPEDLHPLLLDLQRFDQGWDVKRNIEKGPFNIDSITSRLTDTLFFNTGSDKGEMITIGVEPDCERGFDQFKVISGCWFKTGNDPIREEFLQNGSTSDYLITGEILISRELSMETGLNIGDTMEVAPSLIGGIFQQYRVEGIYIDSLSRLSRSAMMHLGELQYMKGLQENDTLTEILIDLSQEEDGFIVKEWSESEDFSYRDIVDFLSSQEMLDEIYSFLEVIDGFAAMVITITALVCFIFTSTLFAILAKERSRDTSILRAIGISTGTIIRWIVSESTLYYLAGLFFGSITGYLSIVLLNDFIMDRFLLLPHGFTPFMINIRVIVVTISITLVLSLLSALLPAFITFRRYPMESLRGDIG